jgi:hypothetical protein
MYEQGDQIGRIFTYWVIVYFGQFLEIASIAHIFEPLFFLVKVVY